MRTLKQAPGRWAIPVALSATMIAGMLISPVIAEQTGVTKKKLNTTINKKINLTALNAPGVRSIGATDTILASLDLSPGSYTVTTTFSARRESAATSVNCNLRLVGVAQDSSTSFIGAPVASSGDSVAMQVSARVTRSTQAQLVCSAFGLATANHIELTALKVPSLRTVAG
jgi:hypothetical protein